MLTQQGRVKRIPCAEFANLTGRGLSALKLKPDDGLAAVLPVAVGNHLVLATSGGRMLRFEVNDQQVPTMGRTAQGLQALRILKTEQLVGGAILQPSQALLLVSTKGFVKRIDPSVLRLVARGAIGNQMFSFATKSDRLIRMVAPSPSDQVILLTDAQRGAQIQWEALKAQKKGGGERLLKLGKGEKVTDAVLIAEQ